MKSSKLMMGLLAMVLVMAFSSSSFAQINIALFNTASAGEVQTSHHAQTADTGSPGAGLLVSGELVAISTLTTTYLTLQFPAPITSNSAVYDGLSGPVGVPTPTAIPAADPITIQGATGLFASLTAVYTVDVANGRIIITLPGTGGVQNTLSGSFRLVGVRIDANGKTAPLTVSASLSSSANNYQNISTPQTLIAALGPGIGSLGIGSSTVNPGAPNNGTALLFSNQITALCSAVIGAPGYSATCPMDSVATFNLVEGFPSAWRTPTQVSVMGAPLPNGNNILLTIAGLPSGISAVLSADYPTGTASTTLVSAVTGGGTFGPGTSNQTVVISFTATNQTVQESLQYDIVLTGTPIGALTAGTAITLTATMTPNSTSGLTGGGLPTVSGGYPRFVSAPTAAITIANIVSANTTLLIPYVVRCCNSQVAAPTFPNASNYYETGIAIANTTADPFGTAGGGANPQNGTMTFTLYSNNATSTGPAAPISFATSSTKTFGSGLDSNGALEAGSVFTAQLSDFLRAVGIPDTQSVIGYMFVQANFLDAHGAAYVYNGLNFTSASPMLVLAPPGGTPRVGPVEGLNN